jgi:hypothetical protein
MKTATQTYPPLTFSESALGHVRMVTLIVRAEPSPVYVYLLDEQNHRLWQSEHRFTHHGPHAVGTFFGPVQLPHPGPWWLVVENRAETPLRVELGVTAL